MSAAAHTPEIFTRVLMQLKDAIRYIEVESAFDGAMTADKVEAKIKENKTIARLEIGANSSHKLARFSIHDARCDVEEAEEFIAEAGTVAHETGLTPRQLADELAKSSALNFAQTEINEAQRKLLADYQNDNKELLEALKELYEKCRLYGGKKGGKMDLSRAKATITKVQQEGGMR